MLYVCGLTHHRKLGEKNNIKEYVEDVIAALCEQELELLSNRHNKFKISCD